LEEHLALIPQLTLAYSTRFARSSLKQVRQKFVATNKDDFHLMLKAADAKIALATERLQLK
jgi:hypothetical protein